MLTVKQKTMLQELRQGEKMDAKEKADFYYRMSKIFKAEAESTIKEMSLLLDEIPDTYLEKIDFYEMANDSMELLEKLVERLEPAPTYGDGEDKKVSRQYRVNINNPIPEIIQADDYKPLAVIAVTYRPDESEIRFAERLKKFVEEIQRSMDLFSKDFRNYTMDEFNKKMKRLKSKHDLKIGIAPMKFLQE